MKYNIGDTVKIRAGLTIGAKYGGITFVSYMKKYEGTKLTITDFIATPETVMCSQPKIMYKVKEANFIFSESMLEHYSEEVMQNFLYDISQRLANLQAALDIADDGECREAIAVALSGMGCEVADAVYDGIGYIKNMEAYESAIGEEIKRLKMKQKAVKNRISRVRAGYCGFLAATGQKSVKTGRGSMTVSTSGVRPVTVTDAAVLPAQYLTVVPEHTEPNMEAIQKAARAGKEIPGVELGEAKQTIRIS